MGPAVISALEIESRAALFPRIIADINVIEVIESDQKKKKQATEMKSLLGK